jgi:hypothetical protein
MNLLVILEGNYVLLLMLSQKRMFFGTLTVKWPVMFFHNKLVGCIQPVEGFLGHVYMTKCIIF